MQKLGFIGVGIMGKAMLRNLMRAGFAMHIYARTRAKVEDVIAEGAVFHDTIGGCVRECEALITMVGFPSDVEEVYLAPEGIFAHAKPGTYLVDMTTSSPELAAKLHAAGKEKGLKLLDAPVTGGQAGAKNAALSIMVGGEKEDYEACLPLFRAMGGNVNYQGKAGCGQHAKLANQIMIAANLSGVCEALTYARAKNLDLPAFIQAVSAGSAGSKQLEALLPKYLAGDFQPGFFVKHFIKDMRLAEGEAEASGLVLPILKQALTNYEELARAGYGELGTQALLKFYDRVALGD